ncbi:uncharacterized protein B0H18DRAFT_236099 [Fomitopsis serialis]|uniref:uncharacterized protein n=1 Tax=Fomitopsis serialis TaxID=139415 RepID=UPI002007AECF|nr:uncharacterized protein B0H18DRAFT_236099 [Neoantrodia serialis]KAH9928966.1 hypothetical protein B0H18DRAFT_236099 [Neoantrodia serialis]
MQSRPFAHFIRTILTSATFVQNRFTVSFVYFDPGLLASAFADGDCSRVFSPERFRR